MSDQIERYRESLNMECRWAPFIPGGSLHFVRAVNFGGGHPRVARCGRTGTPLATSERSVCASCVGFLWDDFEAAMKLLLATCKIPELRDLAEQYFAMWKGIIDRARLEEDEATQELLSQVEDAFAAPIPHS